MKGSYSTEWSLLSEPCTLQAAAAAGSGQGDVVTALQKVRLDRDQALEISA